MHICISSMRKQVNHAPPDDVKMKVSYRGMKLSICFNSSSHVFKRCVAADHQFISSNDLRGFGRNYQRSKSIVECAIALKLFN